MPPDGLSTAGAVREMATNGPIAGMRFTSRALGIKAYDMNRGEIVWQIPNGDTPTFIKEHNALQGKYIPRTGTASHAGPLVTKTLLSGVKGPAAALSFTPTTKRPERISFSSRCLVSRRRYP
jgi:hypothetical protein